MPDLAFASLLTDEYLNRPAWQLRPNFRSLVSSVLKPIPFMVFEEE